MFAKESDPLKNDPFSRYHRKGTIKTDRPNIRTKAKAKLMALDVTYTT